jgi:phosphoacetylglucosamine mutase
LSLQNSSSAAGFLNHQCGADFVQKEQQPPMHGTFPVNAKCVSIDGDADRLVYFFTDETGETTLLDGDKIAALLAAHVGGLIQRCGDALLCSCENKSSDGISPNWSTKNRAPLTVGVVQTAYANGASTKFVEQKLNLKTKCTPTGVKVSISQSPHTASAIGPMTLPCLLPVILLPP